MITLQQINLGQYPNDGTGDDLRTAFTKVNANFSSIALDAPVDSATNVGGGHSIFKDKVLSTLEFKTITSNSNSIAITETANTINVEGSTRLVRDLTPQLGADLNLNGHKIIGAGDLEAPVYGIDLRVADAFSSILVQSNLINFDFSPDSDFNPIGKGDLIPGSTNPDYRAGYTVDFGLFSDPFPVANKVDLGTFTSSVNSIVPVATNLTAGTVRPDSTTISINNGIISSVSRNIQDVAAAMLTSGQQNGITFTYNQGNGSITTTVLGGGGGGGGGLSGVTIQQGGVTQGAANTIATLNFTGNGVTATASGSGATIAIPGYSLPTSSPFVLGGVKVDGSTITINGSGVISATLPTASTSVLGGVKIDGSTITINAGIISATQYSLPTSSSSLLGGVKVDGSTITINGSGVITANYTNYTLPIATTSVLGGVTVDGTTITINGSGVITSNINYNLPTAGTTQLGGVKVDGTTVSINNQIISATSSNIRSVAAALLTGGVQTGITFTYDSLTQTITSTVTGGSGGSGITGISVQDEGSTQGITSAVTTLNFVGAPVTAAVSGNTATISIASSNYTLPTAGTGSVGTLGGVKVDGSTITINGSGVISTTYSLPSANTATLGGVIIPTQATSGIVNSSGTITLATSSTTQLGGVKVDGSTITINGSGTITANYTNYSLPTATTSVLGGVKVDGTTITINGSGVISTILPTASASVLGVVKVDGSTIAINAGIISATYTLPTAGTTQLGGVKVDGSTITVSGTGVISSAQYSLPTASTSVLGGVKIDGTTITITGGVISAASAYTLPSATTSALGGVIIPAVATSGINNTSGTIGLATASVSQLGGVIIPAVATSGITNSSGTISLATASTTQLGGVKVDGTTITISGGIISSTGGGGGALQTRTTVATTTSSLVAGTSATATVTAAKGYALISIQTSIAAWVTVYSSSTAQSNDSGRTITTDPTPGSGVIAEVITTSGTTQYFSPAVFGYNADATVGTNMYLKIYNNTGSSSAITVTVTYLKLEN